MKGFMEEMRDLVAQWTRGTRFYGFFPYKVVDDTTGRPSLQAVGVVDGLPSAIFPDQLYLDKAHGIPGTTSNLAKDTVVLVGFQGGDPGAPFVAFYLRNQPLPVSVEIDASTTITMDAPSILLGGASAVPLAKGGVVDLNFAAVIAKLNTALAALSLPLMGGVSSTATSKAKGL
jgi:hypothetical protein